MIIVSDLKFIKYDELLEEGKRIGVHYLIYIRRRFQLRIFLLFVIQQLQGDEQAVAQKF